MDLTSIDLSDPKFWDLPLAERASVFDQLRSQDPYRYFELPPEITEQFPQRGFHALVRHADVADASRRPEDFCSGQGGTTAVDLPNEEMTRYFGSMISMDDPRHRRLRSIVSAGFTPKRVRSLEDAVDRIAGEIVDDLLQRGPCDFVTEVASRLPLQIICEMMGVPEDRWAMVFEQSNIILGAQDQEYRDENLDLGAQLFLAAMQLTEMMNALIVERVETPTDDLTSALVHAEFDGERLSHDEIASFFILLVVAGNETTRNAISWGLHLLTEHEDQRALWWDDFTAVAPSAVEEVVRWTSPVNYMKRTAAVDTVISGQEIAKGDSVVLFYASANRDEDVFDDPFDFRIDRDPNRHLGFGIGEHFCLGAHMARRSQRALLLELAQRLEWAELAGEPEQIHSSFVVGLKRLPMHYRIRAAA